MARARFLVLVALLAPQLAFAQSCPSPLDDAHRLVLVTSGTFSSSTATLQTFARADTSSPWRATSGPVSALIGYKGVAWSYAFRAFAAPGEPLKVDGDKRVPAGFFKIGRPFGFAPSRLPNYLRIADGMTCVDDAGSSAYNTITSRTKVGWQVHGENMWRVREYRRGLLVNYPTDRRARAGSCIFIHTRFPGATGTNGCVSLPERQVAALQDFAQSGAVLAVLPRRGLARFKGCLP
jgi:L,D-peptidoglycan transpeptidase YkuD (ErfK/YbiS/YcfS/YnhG family)